MRLGTTTGVVLGGLGLLATLQVDPAAATDLETWERLQDTMLIEAADGDLERAAEEYQDLARNLPREYPTRGESLFWLGRALYAQGNIDEARDALRECVRVGVARSRCLELLGQLEVERSAIRTVPTSWSFDTPAHGVVHPWRYADKGAIRLDPRGRLEWRTTIDARGDALVIGFESPEPPPEQVSFLIAAEREAWVTLVAEDVAGHRYRLPVDLRVGAEAEDVELPLSRLVPQGDAPPLDSTRLDRLQIVDVTASHGGQGENVWRLDDFVVR